MGDYVEINRMSWSRVAVKSSGNRVESLPNLNCPIVVLDASWEMCMSYFSFMQSANWFIWTAGMSEPMQLLQLQAARALLNRGFHHLRIVSGLDYKTRAIRTQFFSLWTLNSRVSSCQPGQLESVITLEIHSFKL